VNLVYHNNGLGEYTTQGKDKLTSLVQEYDGGKTIISKKKLIYTAKIYDTNCCPKYWESNPKMYFNPLPLLFKALLHGQKHSVFFSWHLIYILE
jgi:hypothetical protein